MRKAIIVVLLATIITLGSSAAASSPPPKKYTPVSRKHTWKERFMDIGVMYVALWAGYCASQPITVAKIQAKDWERNVFEIGGVIWDDDSWIWNFAAHPIAGSEYYLYFRSRGYAPKWAFAGSFVTSFVFEELIETFSEPFSFNDFLITPVVGSLLGYGRERAALRLLHSDIKFNRFIGHVLWIETNFWFFENAEVIPVSPDGRAPGLTFTAVF